jgi:glycerophosphoryl diester phosphodiesterase
MDPSPHPRAAGRPLVLAHRGASADAPENTLAAFHAAVVQRADGFELDVWRCGSGEPVVIHDASADRTGGSGLDVRAATLSQLRQLDVGAWKGERHRGERIPLLAEVLATFPQAFVNVELKSDRVGDPRLALAVARLVRELGARERVVVSSFDYVLLAAFRLFAPEVPAGLLLAGDQRWRLREALGGALLRPDAVHPELALASDERVAAWRRRGLDVNVWTVDDGVEVERLARAGAAAVISNRPGLAREAVRRATGR